VTCPQFSSQDILLYILSVSIIGKVDLLYDFFILHTLRLSNSSDLNETPSDLASHQDPSRLNLSAQILPLKLHER